MNINLKADCPYCALPIDYCVCTSKPNLILPYSCLVLSHPRELGKRNSTGRIIRNCTNAGHKIWHRLDSESLRSELAHYALVYPSSHDDDQVDISSKGTATADSGFLWLDCTWQESRKMLRQSPWLSQMKRVSLRPPQSSLYRLRRNQQQTGLSTLESMALWLINQHHQSYGQALLDYLELFQTRYQEAQQAGLLK